MSSPLGGSVELQPYEKTAIQGLQPRAFSWALSNDSIRASLEQIIAAITCHLDRRRSRSGDLCISSGVHGTYRSDARNTGSLHCANDTTVRSGRDDTFSGTRTYKFMNSAHQFRGKSRRSNRTGLPRASRVYNESLTLLGNNDAEAFRLNKAAAGEGMHDAVLAMGWFYLNGAGVEADEDEAIRWYRKSARLGDPRAMFSLGQIAYGNQEFSEALTWFMRAMEKEHHRSKYWIGKMYWRGEGVSRDHKRARHLFTEAASKRVVEAQRAIRFLDFALARDKQQCARLEQQILCEKDRKKSKDEGTTTAADLSAALRDESRRLY